MAGSNPHPPNKHIVAKRLADIALKQTYKQIDREVLGPTFAGTKIQGGTIAVNFKHAGGGLVSDDGEALNWFEISDGSHRDGKERAPFTYKKAVATIVAKDTIEVRAASVDKPRYLRFAWHMYARNNLVNSAGLPAFPFRTDPYRDPRKR